MWVSGSSYTGSKTASNFFYFQNFRVKFSANPFHAGHLKSPLFLKGWAPKINTNFKRLGENIKSKIKMNYLFDRKVGSIPSSKATFISAIS